ncbi:MAG: hypothetical protein ABTQ31_03135 [Rhizobiaceae bacterium]
MGKTEDDELGLSYEPSFQLKRDELTAGMNYLQLNELELAMRFADIGDRRDIGIGQRHIRQMLNSRREVPNELLLVLELLKRQRRRVKRLYSKLAWQKLEDGAFYTKAEGFKVRLVPETNNRYHVDIKHKTIDFSPTWPKRQHPLRQAKFMAALKLDDALSQLDERVEEGVVSRSQLSP